MNAYAKPELVNAGFVTWSKAGRGVARGLHTYYTRDGMDLNIGQIQQALSVERLAGYALHGRAEPEEQLIRRYLWNVQLGEALYPVLHFTEIALRNRLHEALSRRAGREPQRSRNLTRFCSPE
jgi:hypothetical protein